MFCVTITVIQSKMLEEDDPESFLDKEIHREPREKEEQKGCFADAACVSVCRCSLCLCLQMQLVSTFADAAYVYEISASGWRVLSFTCCEAMIDPTSHESSLTRS